MAEKKRWRETLRKPSESAQFKEAANGGLQKRQGGQQLLVLLNKERKLDEEKKDDEALAVAPAPAQEYVFVEGDDEGKAYQERKVKKTEESATVRQPRSTDSKKLETRVIVDGSGREYRALNGTVRINLAKFVMRQLT